MRLDAASAGRFAALALACIGREFPNRPGHVMQRAGELVAVKVDVIWVPGSITAQTAHEATTTIPIIFALVSDPVHSGFVRSLAAPVGCWTGRSVGFFPSSIRPT